MRKQKQRLARYDHASSGSLGDALGRVHPDLRAVGADAITIALPYVDGLGDHTLQD
jgi:hypothetical protein